MKVTAKIDRMLNGDGNVKAYASINLDNEFVVRDIAVVQGKNGVFIQMPYRTSSGENGVKRYTDVAFALTDNARIDVNNAVMEAYEQRLHMAEDQAQADTPAMEQRM